MLDYSPNSALQRKKILNSEHMGYYAQLGDWQIHYYEQGEGKPLLLVHGVGQSLYTWHRVVDILSEKNRVIVIDLPGMGYSSKIEGIEYTVEAMAELLVRFLDTIGVKQCDVIAFSLGAIYALRAVELYPQRFNRLILEAPGGITPGMPFFVRALCSPVFSLLYRYMITPRAVRNLLNECFFDQTQVNEELVRETFQPLSNANARNVLINILQNFEIEETMQGLRDIQHETCLIWGMDDRWHDVSMGEQFLILINHSKLVNIRNCGHMIHEEKYDRFLECVLDFLENGLEGTFVEEDNAFY